MSGKMKSLIVSLIFAVVLLALIEPNAAQGGKKVVCYYGTWARYRPGDGAFDVEDIPINLCTHIIYGFTDLGPDNRIALYDPWNDVCPDEGGNYCALKRFNELKLKNPNLKTLVANGGWNAGSNKYSRMAAVPAERAKFVQSVVAFVQKYNFNGFDFDWEYPSCKADYDEDRVCAPSADKANYASLLRELKAALSPYGYLLTAAVHCGKNTIDYAYDFKALNETLDQFHVMTYDYHGAWERVTGHNAPLYANPSFESGNETWLNANWTINYWMSNGIPASKIIMGAAVYGRGVTLTDPKNNGIGAPNNGPIPEAEWTRQNGSWGFHEICKALNQGGWTVVRDPCYQAPYAYKDRNWIGYDDVESLKIKGEYISAMNLGGVMIWEIDTDDFRGSCYGTKFILTETVIKAMNSPASLPPQCVGPPTTTTPFCPPVIPPNFVCICSETKCELVAVTTTSRPAPPSCPPVIPPGYECVCTATECVLVPITTTTTARPTCPPNSPAAGSVCTCSSTSCEWVTPTTTTSTTTRPPPPTCPPNIPTGYDCVCSAISCELVPWTTTARPTCPPNIPSGYDCVCSATTCEFVPWTTTTARPTCPPNPPAAGSVCTCSSTSCEWVTPTTTTSTTTRPPPPTCPPNIPSGYDCVCSAISCELVPWTTTTAAPTSTTTVTIRPPPPTCPPNIPTGFECVCSGTSCVTVPVTTTTAQATVPPSQFDCSGKPNGNYPDPAGPCTGYFYMCSNGIAYLYDCAFQDLVFYPPTDKCEHRSDVYPCNDKKP